MAVPVVEIIQVVTVGDGVVSTARGVAVVMVGVLDVREGTFVVVILVGAVGVTVVNEVEMPFMLDGGVSARRTVFVGMVVVDGVIGPGHGCSSAVMNGVDDDVGDVGSARE